MKARFSLRLGLVCAALYVATATRSSHAANQEPAGLNLGSTSFYDGFGRNEEGFTYLVYAQYSRARSINGDDGNAAAHCSTPTTCIGIFNSPKIDAYLLVNQLVYTLPEKLFNDNAHLGINFILPLVAFDTKFRPPPPLLGTQLNDNGIGLGDLTFGPLLQFKPLIAGGRPVFSHRVEIDFIVPTGKYDPAKDINQGANFMSFNPYWAATVLPLPYLEISARFHYLYNFKNLRPALGYLYRLQVPPENAAGSALKSAQAGQAAWVNFTISYDVLGLVGAGHGLHLGVNGYYFTQFNLDKWEYFDGTSDPGTDTYNDGVKASFLGIGPGALWELGEHEKLFANVYFQTLVYNRPESTVFNLHWVHGF